MKIENTESKFYIVEFWDRELNVWKRVEEIKPNQDGEIIKYEAIVLGDKLGIKTRLSFI